MKQDRGAELHCLLPHLEMVGENSGGPVVKENAGQNNTLDAEEV